MKDSSLTQKPSFITVKTSELIIYPRHNTQAGLYMIRVKLDDGIDYSIYFFQLLVLPNAKLDPPENPTVPNNTNGADD
jgi:hypothetical protein